MYYLEGVGTDYIHPWLHVCTTCDDLFSDDDDSGDDDGDMMTRANLKKQSQSLIDSKNKRRMPKRKGKKK
mgnify:CR=1 FL=1